MPQRSSCPISNVLDLVGDKWSLLVLRDLIFFGKSTYSELQTSDERMATNILSSRLEQLERDGLISKRADANDKRRKVYALTQAGKDMLPLLLEMIVWSSKYAPDTNLPKQLLNRLKNDREKVISELMEKMAD
ncbi:winged helix-turn-helix transcriptional regulator [Shewanella sedimentimangrovi]|uniref:Helix-turn-helix transcriptional regulator n=1 Tax=Shewanella sedimentimangrovi TaxID=2814293 RepID=A0ABX7R560_9GAMM|nr:helix-turn-helix domain-containing protein [Shewanella sedimentimangrovi]QSX38233.1 helix-turn-helix transcriptional regulator [Shewanella sedimentimangrovi]